MTDLPAQRSRSKEFSGAVDAEPDAGAPQGGALGHPPSPGTAGLGRLPFRDGPGGWSMD